jgi:RND superfamily putative drug exporter
VTSAISRPSRDQTWSGCSPCSRTLQLIEFKQMGVGVAAAILIDATVIRGVLLPATLALLGERAWYLPRWLAWLPPVLSAAGRSDQSLDARRCFPNRSPE